MGLASSRASFLPENIDDTSIRKRVIETWTKANILSKTNNSHQEYQTTPTQKMFNIIKAATLMKEFFKSVDLKMKVLEIMAGNCAASSIVHTILNDQIDVWLSTDIISYSTKLSSIPFQECHSVEAVEKHSSDKNVLLLISPPPAGEYDIIEEKFTELQGYGDYYACHDFIEKAKCSSEDKYIVFVGELGASDGSIGMYNYMISHSNLELVERVMLQKSPNQFGDFIEKELFIFKIKSSVPKGAV